MLGNVWMRLGIGIPMTLAYLGLIPPPNDTRGSFVGLGHLSPPRSYAEAISDDGSVIVGVGTGGHWQAWLWTAPTGMVALPSPPGWNGESAAWDVSADGNIIVGEAMDPAGVSGAVLWSVTTGESYPLGNLPGGVWSDTVSVTRDGCVVLGFAGGPSFTGVTVTWTNRDPPVALPFDPGHAIPYGQSDRGHVIGWLLAGNAKLPFRWAAYSGLDQIRPPDSTLQEAYVYAITSDGAQVFGWAVTAEGRRAFRWSHGSGSSWLTRAARYLPRDAADELVTACSRDGRVVVGTAHDRACVWIMSERRDLMAWLTEAGIDFGTWHLLAVQAVSSDGQWIAGHGLNAAGQVEAWRVRLPG